MSRNARVALGLLGGILVVVPARGNTLLQTEELRVAQELAWLPEDKIDIGDVGLRISALLLPDTDRAKGNATIDGMVKLVIAELAGRTAPEVRILSINTVLFKELGFDYDKTDMLGRNQQNSLLWNYLQTKRGNCLTMPLLWYAVAQRLGFPIKAVLGPQHVFLRYEDGPVRINIETTTGSVPTDEQMIRDLEIPQQAIRAGTFMRSLSKREFVAELLADLAAHESERMNLATAEQLLLLARSGAPESLAVHWNLATVYAGIARVHWSRKTAKKRISADAPPPQAMQTFIEYKWAVLHAKHATELGAVPPLRDNYWLGQAVPEHKEGMLRPAATPAFDVLQLVVADPKEKSTACPTPLEVAEGWSKLAQVLKCHEHAASMHLDVCMAVAASPNCHECMRMMEDLRGQPPHVSGPILQGACGGCNYHGGLSRVPDCSQIARYYPECAAIMGGAQ